MKFPHAWALALAATGFAHASPPGNGRTSSGTVRVRYTRLDPRSCKTVRFDREGDFSEQICPGVAGYRLLVVDSDSRMSITVIAPNGAHHPLKFWDTVTPHFSALGSRAEWRTKEGVLRLLIVPLAVNDDPETTVSTRYWIVVRLAGKQACVVQKIRVGLESPGEARRRADLAVGLPCLKP